MWVPEKWKLLLKCTIGQSNWECNCTMRKFQDLSDTQVLREINFGHFESLKIIILDLCLLEVLDVFKCEIPKKKS